MARKYQFVGSTAEYIRFLESRVSRLEACLRQPYQPPPDSEALPGSPASPTECCNSSEAFRPSRPTISQFHATSENQTDGESRQPASGESSQSQDEHEGRGDFTSLTIIDCHPEAHVDLEDAGTRAQDMNKKLQKKSQSRGKKPTKFIAFINDLPSSDIWNEWVSTLGYSKRQRVLQALIQSCCSTTSFCASRETSTDSADKPSNPKNVSVLSKYADFITSSRTLNRQIGFFLEIVFVSLCAIELDISQKEDDVYPIMRAIFPAGTTSKQLLKLVRGAKWANKFTSLLSKTKWASMSWDLLCVARPVSFYARLNDNSTQPEAVVNSVKTHIRGGTVLYDCSDPAIPFAIPLIAKAVFGDRASLQMICECLGCELSSVEAYKAPFHDALRENFARKRPGLPPTELSKRHCQGISASRPDHPRRPSLTNTQQELDPLQNEMTEPNQQSSVGIDSIFSLGNQSLLQSNNSSTNSITTFQQVPQATVPSILSVSSPATPQSTEPSPSVTSPSPTVRSSSVVELSNLAPYDEGDSNWDQFYNLATNELNSPRQFGLIRTLDGSISPGIPMESAQTYHPPNNDAFLSHQDMSGTQSNSHTLSLPPIDFNQLYDLDTNRLFQPQQNDLSRQLDHSDLPIIPIERGQVYNLSANEFLRVRQGGGDTQPDNPAVSPSSTDWNQLCNLATNEFHAMDPAQSYNLATNEFNRYQFSSGGTGLNTSALTPALYSPSGTICLDMDSVCQSHALNTSRSPETLEPNSASRFIATPATPLQLIKG